MGRLSSFLPECTASGLSVVAVVILVLVILRHSITPEVKEAEERNRIYINIRSWCPADVIVEVLYTTPADRDLVPAAARLDRQNYYLLQNTFYRPLRRGKHRIDVCFTPVHGAPASIRLRITLKPLRTPYLLKRKTYDVALSPERSSATVSAAASPAIPEEPDASVTTTESREERVTLTPQDNARPARSEEEVEHLVVAIANEALRKGGMPRADIRAAFEREAITVELRSPSRLGDAATQAFIRVWFEPDAQAGRWLWVPLRGDRAIAVPFDLTTLRRDNVRDLTVSLYSGIDSSFSPDNDKLQVSQPAILISQAENSFGLSRRGSFVSLISAHAMPGKEIPRFGPDNESATTVSKADRQLIGRLSKDVVALQDKVKDMERAIEKLSTTSDKTRRELAGETVQQNVRTLSERLDELFRTLNDLLEWRAGMHWQTTHTTSSVEHTTTVGSRSAAAGEVELDSSWDTKLAKATTGRPYIDALLSGCEVLRTATANATVTLCHLVETNESSAFEVHLDDGLGEDRSTLRCSRNPLAHTPAHQFFIALHAGQTDVLLVLIPNGEYAAPAFDYRSLITGLSGTAFKVAAVVTPARLVAAGEGLYRVDVAMKIHDDDSINSSGVL